MKAFAALALVACSSPSPHTEQPDAAPPVDADLRGDLRVTVVDPATGMLATTGSVVFEDASGTQTVAVDEHGHASARVLPDASVTAIAGTNLMTVLAAQPGDDLVLGAFVDAREVGTFTVNFATFTTAASYDVVGPCGIVHATASPAVLHIRHDCELDAMELLVVARDAGGNAISVAELAGVPFEVGGSAQVPAHQSAPLPFFADYTRADDISAIQVARSVPDGFGATAGANATITTNEARAVIASFPAQHAIVTSVLSSAAHPRSRQQLVVDNPAPSIGFDLGAALLPWLDDVSLAGSDVTITPAPTGDFVVTAILYNHAGVQLDWLVIGPPSATVTLPAIDLGPAPGETMAIDAAAIDSDAVADYASVRAGAFQLADTIGRGHRLPDGTHEVRVSRVKQLP